MTVHGERMTRMFLEAEPSPKEIAAHGFLSPDDPVAISFWIISIAQVAATVFFLMESMNVGAHWKTSMHCGALVTLVAAVHYFYMREFWIQLHGSPILYRYIDWTITVPLQMIEFYLILSAVQPSLSAGVFYRLLFGTVFMLAAGYCGESHFINPVLGFVVGLGGRGFILAEIFVGEAGKCAAQLAGASQYVQESFKTMRYIFGYLLGSVDSASLNLLYNLADLVNKIAFVCAVWNSAKNETLARKGGGGGW